MWSHGAGENGTLSTQWLYIRPFMFLNIKKGVMWRLTSCKGAMIQKKGKQLCNHKTHARMHQDKIMIGLIYHKMSWYISVLQISYSCLTHASLPFALVNWSAHCFAHLCPIILKSIFLSYERMGQYQHLKGSSRCHSHTTVQTPPPPGFESFWVPRWVSFVYIYKS